MRTFEEINAEVEHATSINDAQALLRLAKELDGIGSPQADALASRTRGEAMFLAADYPTALEHYRRALALYENLGDLAGVARVSGNLGNVYYSISEYPVALEYFHRALAIHEDLSDRIGVARVSGNIGNVYYSIGEYPTALDYYRRTQTIHKDLGDRAGNARVTGNMGNAYFRTGDYPTALEHLRRALAIHDDLGDRAGIAGVTGNMGNVYFNTGNYPVALEHYRRALAIHEELGNRAGLASVTGNIGNVYGSMGDFQEALVYLRRALAVHKDLGDRSGTARVTGNVGRVYHATGDYSTALEHYRCAQTLHEDLGDHAGVATTTGNIAAVLLELNRNEEATHLLDRQALMAIDDPRVRAVYHNNRAILSERNNDLDSAREHMLKALAVVAEAGARSEMAVVHERLRDLAQKRNDFAAYIEHNNEYTRITEEIRGREATQKLAMMEAERRIEAERRERDKERALLYGALPKSVADRMIRGEKVSGDHYDNASVIFLDIVGFTTIADRIPPGHVVHLLSQIFSTLDEVCKGHSVTKIKTIGDSYMAVAGVPEAHDDHAKCAAHCALDMLAALNTLEISMPPDLGDTSWVKDVGEIQVRIGIHCGPVTAGVIGTERLQYDVWGDTVNVASRMESTSEPGRIHVSEAFANALGCGVIPRGNVEIKGKGSMNTFWLTTVPERT